MAHLWLHTDGGWIVVPIDGSPVSPPGQEDLRIVPVKEDEWALIVRRAGVTVNGWPLLSGMTLLREGDEVRVGVEEAWFFSSERLARMEALPELDPAPVCPRCKQRIEEDTPSVRCPGCDVWYHETESLPCWSYTGTCGLCGQPTDLSAGYRWTPETL